MSGITKNLSLALTLVMTGAIAAACGGSTTPADSPSGDDSTGAAGDAEESAMSFDDMSAPQKMQHMKKVVAPGMAKVFQSANAEEYADFGCTTCHGPGAKDGNFHMPSADLPKLNMAEMDWEDPVVKFMSESVVPEMAKMLGEEPYNPETHEGFGCMGCHISAE